MTDDRQRIAEIRARHEASTPGEWDVLESEGNDDDGWKDYWVETDYEGGYPICGFDESGLHNLKFIAHAHQDVPWLLDKVERLERENSALQKSEVDESLLIPKDAWDKWEDEFGIDAEEDGSLEQDESITTGSTVRIRWRKVTNE